MLKKSKQSLSFMRNQSTNQLQKWLRWVERILTIKMIRLRRMKSNILITQHLRRKIQRKHMPLQQLLRIREEKGNPWMSNSWRKTVRDRLRANSSKATTRNRPWHKSTPKTLTKSPIASEMPGYQILPWWITQTPMNQIYSIVNL